MEPQRVFITISLLLLNCTQFLSAQTGDTLPERKKIPIEISFINHAVSMPFDGIIIHPLHPGFSIGTEYSYTNLEKCMFYQALNGGYFYNKYVAKALFLQTETGFRYKFKPGFFADAGIGVGYLHSFHPAKEVFALNENGMYEEVRDFGKPAFIVSVCIGAGYDFNVKTRWPISGFLRYQPLIQMPYSKESNIYPHLMIHVGIRLFFNNKKRYRW
jgi:hypothetical protein